MSPASIARVFRRRNLQLVLLALLAIGAAVWITFQVLQPLPPRTIVIASGVEEGLYHRHAQRYATWLREHGIRVVERKTSGAAETTGCCWTRNQASTSPSCRGYRGRSRRPTGS
jgi:hypothetical protein